MIPAELPIAAVNALGKTTELDDVNTFMADFYSYDDQRNMKAMIKGIQESKIKPGLLKMVNECWQALIICRMRHFTSLCNRRNIV